MPLISKLQPLFSAISSICMSLRAPMCNTVYCKQCTHCRTVAEVHTEKHARQNSQKKLFFSHVPALLFFYSTASIRFMRHGGTASTACHTVCGCTECYRRWVSFTPTQFSLDLPRRTCYGFLSEVCLWISVVMTEQRDLYI